MAYSYCPYCARELGADQVCSHCGQTPESYKPQPHHFPAGTILDQRYWVGQVLGEGGFGITYLGYDAKLERRLAIKEYYPSHIVHRTSGATEVTCYQKDREEFDKGREQFLNEARVLAKLDSVPNIVRVLDYFPANGTAYIVMEFLEGETLKARLKKNGPMEPDALFALLDPLFIALERLHETGLIHRDISPDNIMLLEGTDEVKLMDFGCARDVNSGLTMTVMLKPGFAPIEQYSGHEQGPWTDVYALSATIYHCLTGKRLPNAVNRSEGDTLLPPSRLDVKITPVQEDALMTGLAVMKQDRWQSVGQLRKALKGEIAPKKKPEQKSEKASVPKKKKKALWLLVVAALLVLCLGAVLLMPRENDPGEAMAGLHTMPSPETAAPETTEPPAETESPDRTIPETTAPVSVQSEPMAAPAHAAENVLMESVWGRHGKTIPGSDPVFNTRITQEQVLTITFLDTLADAPADAVDVSFAQNGRVLAWTEESDTEQLYHLYIGGEGGVCAPENAGELFYSMFNLERIHFGESFYTDRTRDMSGMFDSCQKLVSLDVSGFDTSSVENMSYMFHGCENLTTLNVGGFDTASVRNMSNMFAFCPKVQQLDIIGFDTSRVTNMRSMFHFCQTVTELDVTGFDTSSVTDMSYMFAYCAQLGQLDVGGFDTSLVTDMSHMFETCMVLTELDVSGFDTSSVTNMRSMFDRCQKVTALDVSGFDTSNVTDMASMFCSCFRITELDVSSFDTSSVTDMEEMFAYCENLRTLDLSGFDTSKVTNMGQMFHCCPGLKALNVSGFDTVAVENMHRMFYGCSQLENLDLSSFDTGSVSDMYEMFFECMALTDVPIGRLDTSNVTAYTGFMREGQTVNGRPWQSYFE